MTTHEIKFYPKQKPTTRKPKTDFSSVDGQKLQYHPERVVQVLQADTWDKAKDIYPIYIEVSPLNTCNHSCLFCGVDYYISKDSRIVADTYAERIREMSALGVKSVMFAGEGEPLLHKDISKMVSATKKSGIDVAFTTNGVPMTLRFIQDSMKYISWIKVSFNAGSSQNYAKIHRCKEKDFFTVLENIRIAVAYKKSHGLSCDVGMQMVLLDDNAHEAEEFVKLAKSVGCDYAVVKRYSQQLFSNTRQYENTDYSKYMDLGNRLKAHNTEDFSVVFRSNSMVESEPYSECMSTPHLWAYVDAKMNVYACSAYLGQERFNLGNLKERSFQEIWQGEKRRKLFEEGIDISGCRSNCRMDSCNRFLDSVKNQKVHNANFI